jgi:membrane associated rhomboid family serine protease
MGIYDRDYYRKDGPSFLGMLMPSGQVCKWLIGINVAVYIVQLATRPDDINVGPFTDALVLDTRAVLHGQVWRLLTYAFLHSPDTIFHILFNMLFLWWFGSSLEELYGPREFALFYLASALAGGIAFTAWSTATGEPGYCLGASGAVTAALVLYACHFPHAVIYMFFFLPVPIWFFALFNVAQDAFMFLGRFKTQTAVLVHLTGAAFAVGYYWSQIRLSSIFNFNVMQAWRRARARGRLKLYRPEAEAPREPVSVLAPSTPPPPADEHFEARLDAVLAKIARTGKESLTEDERRILVQASELYKKRRT